MPSRRIVIAVCLAAVVAYAVWPLVGLYQLGSALHSGDADAVLERVDIAAVRRSIVGQVVEEASREIDIGEDFGEVGRQLAIRAAAAQVDLQLAAVFTPEVLRDLIVRGSLPPEFSDGAEGGAGNAGGAEGFSIGVPENPLGFVRSWRYSTLRRVRTVIGASDAQADWTGLSIRLSGGIWRLDGVELPRSVLDRVRPVLREKIEALRSAR